MIRVLFVIPTLEMGGSVTSLLNMLELLKNRRYKVDLFVMEHIGMFMDRGRDCANLLPEDKVLASSICDPKHLKKYGFIGFGRRAISKAYNILGDPEKNRASFFRNAASKLSGYDVVVSYEEGTATDFARFISAKHHVAWVHTMYEKFVGNLSHKRMLALYKNFDDIICVAPAAADAFKEGLPEYADRVSVIPNPINSDQIKKKALLETAEFPVGKEALIIQMGRLSFEKQYDLSIRVAAQLKKEGIAFHWGIIGEGNERAKLEQLIKELDVSDKVFLLGARSNPYPIVAAADVLVITSLYEAQPMVANEALILNVPVISTDYPAAKTLLKHEETGLICETSMDGVYTAIKKYLLDSDLQKRLKCGALHFYYDSDSVIDRVLDLLFM